MIRNANLLDVPWLLEQLKQFDQFFGSKKRLFPEDPETATRILEGLITTQLFFIAENGQNGQPLGFIAGALTVHPFNPEIRVLSELLWWVSEKHRGTSAGARLFNQFMDYGKEHADWVIMTLEEGSPVRSESLTKRGMKRYETGYLLEVEH